MASPQESITTVNGRRCTRSRARFAASSSLNTSGAAVVVTTQVTTSTTVQLAPQIRTSAAADANPVPPASSAAPPSTAPAEQSVAAPSTPAAASSAIGTISPVSIPPAQPTVLANVTPSVPVQVASAVADVPAAPVVPVELTISAPVVVTSQVIAPATSIVAVAKPSSSSDTLSTAISSILSVQPSLPVPVFTAPPESAVLLSSVAIAPGQSSQTGLIANPPVNSPLSTVSGAPSLPTGESAAGVISPGRAPGTPDEQGLTIPSGGNASVRSIVGGVIGGVGGLAFICAILFIYLRKKNRGEPQWFEKPEDRPSIQDRLKAIPKQVGVLLAKVKGSKKGPASNSYRRHTQHDSISSIYSGPSHRRSQSMSEPRGLYVVGSALDRSSSRASRSNKNGDPNVLRNKHGSIPSQSTSGGIMAELDRDPFADPEPPKTLQLLNPDPNSPGGPLTPQPAATVGTGRNPFVSPPDHRKVAENMFLANPPVISHGRNRSSASALSLNPPKAFAIAPNKPATETFTGPPPPNQAVLSGQKRHSSIAYPQFNTTSTTDSRDSYYGEPGPSRPGTDLFTSGLPTGRTVRQSDPFDLDRPEVLGFGNVAGRRDVRSSVTRQGTLGRRTSSVGNWYNVSDQSYGRDSAAPRPLWSAGGRR